MTNIDAYVAARSVLIACSLRCPLLRIAAVRGSELHLVFPLARPLQKLATPFHLFAFPLWRNLFDLPRPPQSSHEFPATLTVWWCPNTKGRSQTF